MEYGHGDGNDAGAGREHAWVEQPHIAHIDLDAFFAAVEQRDNPALRGTPVIVGGLGERGVVATASYEARKYGVHSALPMKLARQRCPGGTYLSPRFDRYRELADVVFSLANELSARVERVSIDEAYLDLTEAQTAPTSVADVEQLLYQLRNQVLEATGLALSAGAGTSKLIAKLASDAAKPDGQLVVAPGTELNFLHPRAVRDLPGVGPVTAQRLETFGVVTIGDLAEIDPDELATLLGESHGRHLAELARGHDPRTLVVDYEAKQIGHEETFPTDITSRTELQVHLTRMTERVSDRLRSSGRAGRLVQVKVRLNDFSTFTRSGGLPGATDRSDIILATATQLLDTALGGKASRVRLLGVSVGALGDLVQDTLFAPDYMNRVTHPIFGNGTVLERRPGNVRIRFDDGRVRELDPQLAHLKTA